MLYTDVYNAAAHHAHPSVMSYTPGDYVHCKHAYADLGATHVELGLSC